MDLSRNVAPYDRGPISYSGYHSFLFLHEFPSFSRSFARLPATENSPLNLERTKERRRFSNVVAPQLGRTFFFPSLRILSPRESPSVVLFEKKIGTVEAVE